MNILIVGAGPAGLATANFLNTKKHAVTIIEKEKKFSTMGFGIFFFNEGKKLLRKATHDRGIHAFLKQIGYKYYLNEHGKMLSDIHYNSVFHVSNYNAITSIKREDLHGLLRKHLHPDVSIKMGTTISHIDNKPDCAHVELSDGTKTTFDLVISAEGSHSQLRDLFFSYKIKKLPWVARYFWLEKTKTRFFLEWSQYATIMCMPHKNKTTMLSIESNDIYASCNEHQIVPKELQEFYTSIGVSKEEIEKGYKESYVAPMKYVYTDRWFMNRVVLIGDAQHAMTPTLGFGTSLALDDAYELATMLNTLDDSQNLKSGLGQFSTKRTHRVRTLRRINRVADFFTFHHCKPYFAFWSKHHYLSEMAAKFIDRGIRLGWKYA